MPTRSPSGASTGIVSAASPDDDANDDVNDDVNDDFDDDADDDDDTSMEKQVLAFYYPWYRNPDYTGYWSHWNSEGHDPDQFVSPGRRDIASKNYPVLDAYDSLDPAVIDLHIQQSLDAGIDAWIISWWGNTEDIAAVLDRINALQSPLKVTAYFLASKSTCTLLTPILNYPTQT